MGLQVTDTNNFKVEAQFGDSAVWETIVASAGVTESGGAAPTTDIVAFEGIARIGGRRRVPEVSIEVAAFMPALDAHRKVERAAVESTTVRLRYTSEEVTQFAATDGVEAAIADTGIATITGTGAPDLTLDEFGPGSAFRIGSATYVIASINDSGIATVAPAPASAVAKASFSIVIPSVRRGPVTGKFSDAGNVVAAVESGLTTTITFQPRAQLPAWTVVVS